MTDDSEAIDATYDEVEEHVAPSAESISRASVLSSARSLNSAAIGTAAYVEQYALQGRVRAAFLEAWRQWHGSWTSWYTQAERCPVNLVDAQRTVARQAELLEQWRQGMQGEVGTLAQVGAVEQPKPVVQKVTAAVNTLPWWLRVALGIGAIGGAYIGAQWLIHSWAGAPPVAPSDSNRV